MQVTEENASALMPSTTCNQPLNKAIKIKLFLFGLMVEYSLNQALRAKNNAYLAYSSLSLLLCLY